MRGIVERWRRDYARATAYQRCCALRQFFRWLRAAGGPDLSHEVPRVPQPSPRKRIASPDELASLLSRADALLRAIIIIVVDTACRPGESLKVCPEHLNAERRIITVPQLKNHPPKQVPASDRLVTLFAQLPPAAPMTPVAEIVEGHPVSYDLLEHRWLALKKRAAIPLDLRLHDLRRTTATALHEVCKDIFAVQQLLGHRTLHATTSYISNADPEKLRPLLKLLERPGKQERIQ